jgi:hypothetical protein
VQPSVEESADQQIQLIDSIENCAAAIAMYKERFGVEHFVFFLDLPGMERTQLDEQIHMLTEQILPMAGITIEPLGAAKQDLTYNPYA